MNMPLTSAAAPPAIPLRHVAPHAVPLSVSDAGPNVAPSPAPSPAPNAASPEGPGRAPARAPQAAAPLPLCLLVATGGTIAMQVDAGLQAPVPALAGGALLDRVAGLAKVARVEVQDFGNLPSASIGPCHWLKLQHQIEAAVRREDVAGIVVSHGTDTLEETAWFLDLTLEAEKPVVLVGAQRHASEPDSDGPRNLRDAVRVATAPAARGQGVLVVMNGEVHAARDVTKAHTSDVGGFHSGSAGLLGTVDDERLLLARAPMRRQPLALHAPTLPRVDIVVMHAGADGALLRAAVQAGARGIVVQALGLGNVNAALLHAVREAVEAGVVVAISTRVPRGRVRPVYGFEGGGQSLQDAGAVFADDLGPAKARILLMLALQTRRSRDDLQRLFDR